MRRQPGVSLFHPPARKPSALRRYGAFAAIGLLAGGTVGLGLTQMPVGQVTAIKPAADKNCEVSPRAADGVTARCATARPHRKPDGAQSTRCPTSRRCPATPPREPDATP